MPCNHFRRDLALVRGFVRQHRLPHNVANRKNVRHIGTHLLIHRNKAACIRKHTRFPRVNQPTIRRTPNRHQHPIKRIGRRRTFALKRTHQPFWSRRNRSDFGVQVDVLVHPLNLVVQGLYDVTIRTGHQTGGEFHHGNFCTERVVNRRHFQPDNPTAHHQQPLRDFLQFQRIGGIHYPWIIPRNKRQFRHPRTRRNNAVGKFHGLLAAIRCFHFDGIG